MEPKDSPSASMESSSDTSRLLKELMDLQKSTASTIGSIDQTLNTQESQEVGGGDAAGGLTQPTIQEFMSTMYEGTSARQLITLQGNDVVNSFSVFGQEVDIVASKHTGAVSQSTTGSNKVKITPVVNYDWEHRRYVGNLVAVHRNNVFAAYVLKGKTGGVVRVVNRKTAERSLFKDFSGRVIDLAFAHTDEVLLAVVDELGNLFVYSIREDADRKIVTTTVLQVQRPEGTAVSEYHRVIWCPFIPDDCDDSSITESSTQDASRVLVLTNDEKAEIWSLDLISKDGDGPVDPDSVEMGLIKINSHVKPIMDAAFSPDGTALATASLDGEIKFFQVYMDQGTSPRCLHQWKPHGGKPLSCLFFLDDHKNFSPDAQFWKFAVTGANNNQEIKLWSCESWNCLQTLRFLCPPGLPSNFSVEPCMKAALDLSARYLILSDIKRKVLYVLQLHQDNSSNTAHVSSISEFLLTQPCLSFAILDAGTKKFKKTRGDDSHLDEITTGEIEREETEGDENRPDDNTTSSGVQIKLYTVHTKALQELLVRFIPESSAPQPPPPSCSSISQEEAGLRDALSDISMSVDGSGDQKSDTSFTAQENSDQPILLTPEAFTASPRKYPDESMSEQVRMSASSTSSFTHVTGLNDDFLSPRSSSGGSTITQTPTTPQNVDLYSPSRTNQDITPSSVPLPPISSCEESELATPTSTPREEQGESSARQVNGNLSVDEMFSMQDSRKDLIMSQGSSESTGASTGVFDVTGIAEHKKPQASYDENDEEVAEVMGESVGEDSDEHGEGPAGETQPFEGTVGEVLEKPHSPVGDPVLRAWPRPPDVGTEAQRLAAEVIEESTQGSVRIEDQEEEEGDDQEGDAEVIVEEEEEVEGEKEEEIEEQIEEEEEEEPAQTEGELGLKQAPIAFPLVQQQTYPESHRESQPVEVKEIHREIVREVLDKKDIQDLRSHVESVLSALEAQQQQLDQLRQDLLEQQEQHLNLQRQQVEQEQLRQMSQESQTSIEEQMGKLENIVASRVERLFSQHSQRENQRIQELMRQTETREQQKQDRLYNTVTQTLNSAVSNNLEKTVRTEVRNTVIPNVTRVLEPVREQIHQEMAQKLTATDALLKDNIGKMIRSRQTVETLGIAAGNAIQAPIQVAYREAFQNLVIPSFEKATQGMLQQINETFLRGTRDYTRQLDSHLEQLRQKHLEVRDPIVSEMKKLTDTFQTTAEQIQAKVLTTIQSQLSSEVKSSLTGMQDNLIRFVRDAVREEVAVAVKEQGANISDSVLQAMRSGAVTPVQVSPDPQMAQAHILNLLRQGQLNAAFQQALSASNLELVMFVCETVNPSQVFNQTPCPLQQPVLLSLIQQLSADIGHSTDLKHKYLEEAVMNLDKNNSVTQEHLKGVLYGLTQKLQTYIQAHPNAKSTRSLKMLQMASESLLK